MKTILERVTPLFGPKMTGLVAGITTALGQLESRLTTSEVGVTAIDIVTKAVADGNLLALLPAPAAAIIGYVARKSDSPDKVDPNKRNLGGTTNSSENLSVSIPHGMTLSDSSNVPNLAGDGFYTYGELVRGEHRPMTITDLHLHVKALEHTVDAVNASANDSFNMLRNEQKVLRKQFNELLTALEPTRNASGPTKDAHEIRAESVPAKVIAVKSDTDPVLTPTKLVPGNNNFKFSQRSLRNIATVEPLGQRVIRRALELTEVDFIVTRGKCTREEQAKLMRQKPPVTWTINSRHLYGFAWDVAAIDENGNVTWAWPYYVKIAEAMKQAAIDVGAEVICGAIDWNKDGPHTQLSARTFPDDGSLAIPDPYNL